MRAKQDIFAFDHSNQSVWVHHCDPFKFRAIHLNSWCGSRMVCRMRSFGRWTWTSWWKQMLLMMEVQLCQLLSEDFLIFILYQKTVNFTIIHTFANNSQQIHAHQKTEKCKVENEKVVGSFDEFSVLIGSGISFRVKKTFPSLIESFLQDFHQFQKTHDPVNEEQDWRSFHIYPKLEFCIRLNLNHCCRKR